MEEQILARLEVIKTWSQTNSDHIYELHKTCMYILRKVMQMDAKLQKETDPTNVNYQYHSRSYPANIHNPLPPQHTTQSGAPNIGNYPCSTPSRILHPLTWGGQCGLWPMFNRLQKPRPPDNVVSVVIHMPKHETNDHHLQQISSTIEELMPMNQTPTQVQNTTVQPITISGSILNYRPNGETLPQFITSSFTPTVEMELSVGEVIISAYVFQKELDPSEILLKINENHASRSDFECLCPGKRVSKKIIHPTTLKNTWIQQHTPQQKLWTLPPSFESDINEDTTVSELFDIYGKNWIWPFHALKHILVPMNEMDGHWFLMWLSIEEQLVYLLGSRLNIQNLSFKLERIHHVCTTLSAMLSSSYYPENFLEGKTSFAKWKVFPAQVTNNVHSDQDNSAIWLLHWMNSDHHFQASHMKELNENSVRMRVALDLVFGEHNETYNIIQKKASIYWGKLKCPI
ncbi:Papain-like cysteine peptidase superfamily [Sesbania bispinosa]|nr:Papain-like cysteine peptidase superfamily [Sesbania bispinosa]